MVVLVALVSHQILMDLPQLEQVVVEDLDQVLEVVVLAALAVAGVVAVAGEAAAMALWSRRMPRAAAASITGSMMIGT